jgi:dTDP-glucose 4,6-dehydratase
VYNLGGGEEATNREITGLVLAHTGADESLVRRVEDRPGHDRRYSLDTTKARDELGWEPRTRLAQGFPLTAAWYAENRAWWEPIKASGGYREYYEKQYAARLAGS